MSILLFSNSKGVVHCFLIIEVVVVEDEEEEMIKKVYSTVMDIDLNGSCFFSLVLVCV